MFNNPRKETNENQDYFQISKSEHYNFLLLFLENNRQV